MRGKPGKDLLTANLAVSPGGKSGVVWKNETGLRLPHKRGFSLVKVQLSVAKGLDFVEGIVLDLNSVGYGVWQVLRRQREVVAFRKDRRRLSIESDSKGESMASIDEQILRASKEIVVKFIEVGRVSPTTFHESFRDIYATVQGAVKGPRNEDGPQETE